MRTFDDETPWAAVRRDLRHTRATLKAAAVHGPALKEIQKLLDRWHALNQQLIDAEDAVVDSHAQVAWHDGVLDERVGAFARDLDHAVGGDRSHRTFTSFFPQAPNEVIRLGLESEIERTAHFDQVAGALKLAKNAQDTLRGVGEARTAGSASLKAREESVKSEALTWLRVRQLKDDANAVRRSVFNTLERHAIDRGIASGYAGRFFLLAPRRTRKVKATTGGAPTGPVEPTKG
jgi:hypothetical protein